MSVRLHSVAAAGFVLLALGFTWPLGAHLATGVPGASAGDNVTYLWDLWWMRHVVATHARDAFHTTYLFYPFGTSLALHTHDALQAVLGATILSGLTIIGAQNVLILGSLALTGFCAYLLAWDVTSHRGGAVLAGVFFATSPFFAAHALGHFNLLGAWVLPLFALFWLRALDRRAPGYSLAAGIVLVLAAYTDYYYVLFLAGLGGCVLACRWVRVSWRVREGWRPAPLVDRTLCGLSVVLVLAAIAVVVTGGGTWSIGSRTISATSGFNLRTAAWIVFIGWAVSHWRPTPRIARIASARPTADLLHVMVLVLVFAAGTYPLLAETARMWGHGDYASQTYFWRNAPEGVDPVGLVLGSPFHRVWGPAVQHVYARLGINAIENTAWLGLAPLVLLIATRATWRTHGAARVWVVVGSAFFVWALGPSLRLAGVRTGLYLPAVLLRFIPFVANGRMPGRAMVMVYLAVAVLLAIAMASSRRGSRWLPVVVAAVIVDFAPAPMPMFTPDRPSVYVALASRPDAGVLEIPLGIRDGFGELGALDHRVLYYQSISGKPMVGGFVARMSNPLRQTYEASPVLGVLLRLSAGEAVDPELVRASRDAAPAFLRSHGIGYMVVNTDTTPAALMDYVLAMPARLVALSDGRRLYVLE
jgi:hypothetical protein